MDIKKVIKNSLPSQLSLRAKLAIRIDQNHFLYQAVNLFFSDVKLGILAWEVYGIDSLLEPVSIGQSTNCSLSHVLDSRERLEGCRLVV